MNDWARARTKAVFQKQEAGDEYIRSFFHAFRPSFVCSFTPIIHLLIRSWHFRTHTQRPTPWAAATAAAAAAAARACEPSGNGQPASGASQLARACASSCLLLLAGAVSCSQLLPAAVSRCHLPAGPRVEDLEHRDQQEGDEGGAQCAGAHHHLAHGAGGARPAARSTSSARCKLRLDDAHVPCEYRCRRCQ